MSRWEEVPPHRFYPQEEALLALLGRMEVLEQAFKAEVEARELTRKRLDHVQRDYGQQLASLRGSVSRMKAETRSILDILGREE